MRAQSCLRGLCQATYATGTGHMFRAATLLLCVRASASHSLLSMCPPRATPAASREELSPSCGWDLEGSSVGPKGMAATTCCSAERSTQGRGPEDSSWPLDSRVSWPRLSVQDPTVCHQKTGEARSPQGKQGDGLPNWHIAAEAGFVPTVSTSLPRHRSTG